ncbi:MAG: PEP-CTERM sorting domain-containing protein, partial [Verrucomicrobiae bacterium]|nr:PEP-CTERM sorting domain-containing protein [Verrucomicrobiae bacterium]
LMSTGTFYDHSYAGEFTGYLALRVKEVKGAPDFYYVFDVGTVNGWDPFGKLQANEALAIYLEPTKDFNVNAPITGSGIRLTDVAWATDGSLFATFGFGSVGPSEEVRGFYSAVNLTILGHLEVLQNPGAWQWLGVVSLPAVGSVTNDLALDNLTFTRPAPSSAAWDSKTDDGLRFRLVPEPATLASLFGLGAAGGLGWIFRRRKLS